MDFVDAILEAIRLLLLDLFGEWGSWKSYIVVACMWLVAVMSLIGMVWIVIEWIIKAYQWVRGLFRRKK